jgi:glutamine amidotransferase
VQTIVPGNKVNLLIYDGELFYAHKNERGTLHQKELEEGMLFSTQPLTQDGWKEFPQNQLMVYKDGDLVYAGKKHDHTYVHNEERMKLLYLAYAGL